MKETVLKYIDYMREKHGIIAAMVTGSFVTGDMGPRSDIDMFFIWTKAYQSIRGREYFEGLEFEYFISPEWKYYDRLRTDKTSMRIYSGAMILADPENKLENIKNTAIRKVEEYQNRINTDMKKDYTFWLETICSDGEDLFDKKDYSNFLFFTGSNLQKMSDLLCGVNIEPLMTKVMRFLGTEHTCRRISLLTAVSLIYQAIPVVPTVLDSI